MLNTTGRQSAGKEVLWLALTVCAMVPVLEVDAEKGKM
jgi:hypothetical protein